MLILSVHTFYLFVWCVLGINWGLIFKQAIDIFMHGTSLVEKIDDESDDVHKVHNK